jgi:hypothetical protein
LSPIHQDKTVGRFFFLNIVFMTRNPGSVFTAVSYTSRSYPACEYGIRQEELRRCC